MLAWGLHFKWRPATLGRWRFTQSGCLPCGKRARGRFVKVDHWPSLSVSRTDDGGEAAHSFSLHVPYGHNTVPILTW